MKEGSFINESFLRDQIAGMQKIDKLVEEAEQSIGKVVKGFDKYFKDPKMSHQSADGESKHRNHNRIDFKIDDLCDCPSTERCDCETTHASPRVSFINKAIPPFRYSDPPVYEPPTDSDHLNTISEHTETNDPSSYPTSGSEGVSDSNDGKPFGKIGIDDAKNTRQIVHLPPITIPVAKAPVRVETGTETDSGIRRINTNVLEVQTMPGVQIRPSFVIQKIYNIQIKPTGSLNDQSNIENHKNTIYIEIEHGSANKPKNSDVSTKSKQSEVVQEEITVLKAPSCKRPKTRYLNKTCTDCAKSPNDSSTPQKHEVIEELLDDIRAFQVPVVSGTSCTSSSHSSSSEYIVVQDNETQVSIKSSSHQGKAAKPGKGGHTPSQFSSGNNTSTNTFPTNVRPPIPGLPIADYKPLPYETDELDEVLISAKPLEGSNITAYDLSTTQDPMIKCSSKCMRAKPKIVPPTQDIEVSKQPSNDFTLESCSLTTLEASQKIHGPDADEDICLANAFDFNPAREGSITCDMVNCNLTCCDNPSHCSNLGKPPPARVVCSNALNHRSPNELNHGTPNTLNHAMANKLKNGSSKTSPNELNHGTPITLDHRSPNELNHGSPDTLNYGSPNELNLGTPPNILTCVTANKLNHAKHDELNHGSPNELNDGTPNNTPSPAEDDFRHRPSDGDRISLRPVTFASRDIEYSQITLTDTTNVGSTASIATPPILNPIAPMNIEGMQITPNYTRPTVMPALVEYDQDGVNESLRQNLLLAQLNDNAAPPTVIYNKPPLVYVESSSSTENSSRSSGDYPQRHKYLIRAKRRKAYQRGIITDDEDDFILSRSPDRGDPISDGEMSRYDASTVVRVLPWSGVVVLVGVKCGKQANMAAVPESLRVSSK